MLSFATPSLKDPLGKLIWLPGSLNNGESFMQIFKFNKEPKDANWKFFKEQQ